MKVTIISVGKTDESFLEAGIQKYTTKLKNYLDVEWKLLLPPKNSSSLPLSERRKKETDQILNSCKPGDYIIVLGERGESLTSVEFADFILQRSVSNKSIVFVIGGAFGVTDVFEKTCDFNLALSKMTFTHQMVRLIFVEQLYRAYTIIKGTKYHH